MDDSGKTSVSSRLGLGTVQFGLDYGVTNAAGRVAPEDVNSILDRAASDGIGTLDTAFLYGESEAVVGRSGRQAAFEIITKTDKVSGARNAGEAADRIERAFEISLSRLGVAGVDGLLVHDVNDLLGIHADAVWRRLTELRATGRARRIGVSVYEGREIDRLIGRFDFDLVQLPFNALDRRLAENGQLSALAARGVEIHARSIFLQGVLLQPPERLPAKLAPLRPVVTAMRESFTRAGLTVMEGLIASVLHQSEIDRIIVGTTSLRDLEEIVSAATRVGRPELAYLPDRWDVSDVRLLNPAMWNAL